MRGAHGRRRNPAPHLAASLGDSAFTTKEEINAALERSDLQQEHVEVALEIEAELAGAEYEATPDELAAIDKGLPGTPRATKTSRRTSPCFGKHEGGSNIWDNKPETRQGLSAAKAFFFSQPCKVFAL